MSEDFKRFYGSEPKLIKNKIIRHFPSEIMVEIQASTDKYMRIKFTPAPSITYINTLEHLYGVETTTYNTEDYSSCIVEIGVPRFDIVITRDTRRFPKYDGWILQVIRNNNSSGSDVICTMDYNPDHPYNLKIAEHLIEYLNRNAGELERTEYEEIYTL